MINIKHISLTVLVVVLLSQGARSQMAVSVLGIADPDPSAILDLQSNNMGFLATRMTAAEIAAIPSPAFGLMVFQTDGIPGFYYNIGTKLSPVWNRITDDTTPIGYWTQTGSDIYYTTGNVGIGLSNPTVALDVAGAARITGTVQLTNGATDGYVLGSDASGNATWQDVNTLVTNDGDWTVDGNDIYNQNSGNIGIGTSSPAAKLDVQGSAIITGALQLSNSPTDGYVLTSDASGNATWQAAPGGDDGDWTITGNDMTSVPTGNVGIGKSPTVKLDVNGPGHFSDSLYVTGRPGGLFINGETTYEPFIRFAYEGNSKLRLHYRIGNAYFPDPSLMIDSDIDTTLWGVTTYGKVKQRYVGNGFGYILTSAAAAPAFSVDNSNGTVDSRAIQAVLSNTSVPAAVTIGGWGYGLASGLYGQNNTIGSYGHIGSQYNGVAGYYAIGGNSGTLGSENYGVYGSNVNGYWGAVGVDGASNWGVYGDEGALTNPNYGGIATANHGASGYNGNGNWGALGTNDYGAYGEHDDGHIGTLGNQTAGVFGQLYTSFSNRITAGEYAVKGYGPSNDNDDGSGRGFGSSVGSVLGYNNDGTQYSFSVAGYTENANENNSGGVLGSNIDGTNWGALYYRDNSGTLYSCYLTNSTIGTGTGKGPNQTYTNIGLGVYGELFGARINGDVYGIYASGQNYSIYAEGDVYRTGSDIHLQKNDNGENSVMYTLVSTEMTVQTYGIGQLQGGKSNIVFDDAFSNVVSSQEPIIVTITPIGKSEGVYLEQVDGNGFAVGENNNGRSTVQFSWIAIGKRKGYENISLPQDVIAGDYSQKVNRGLSNDNDDNASSEGLYYQDGMLHNGHILDARTNSSIGGSSTNVALKPAVREERLQSDKNSKKDEPFAPKTTISSTSDTKLK